MEDRLFELNNKTKRPKLKGWSKGDSWVSYDETKDMEDVALVPPVGKAIIDADTPEAVKQIQSLIKQLGLEVFSYPTTRGRHFLFSTPEGAWFDSLSSSTGVGIFDSPTKIDFKGGGRNGKNGYVKVKGDGVWREDYNTIMEEFDKAPEAPISLLIRAKDKINLSDYIDKDRDEILFKNWLTKLRAAGLTQEQFIKFAIELKVIAKDPESVEDTIEWAKSKWDSSVSMGEVKDYTGNDDKPYWKQGFKTRKETVNGEDVFQVFDIKDYTVVADYIIDKLKIVISKEDWQIWGEQDGVFKHMSDFNETIDNLLASEVGNIKPSVFGQISRYVKARAKQKLFSSNKFAVSFNNVIIDTLEKRIIDIDDKYMNQNIIPHKLIQSEDGYEEEGKFIDKLMKGWTLNDKNVEKELYELIGLSMTKYTGLDKAYFLLGTGSNGKSMFLNMLIQILGDENVSHEDLKELSEDKFSTSELYGKLANINTDISSRIIQDPSLFKKITSGEKISGENKGSKKFRFAPYATFVFGSNNVPYTNEIGDSDGSNRRIKIIPFNNIFESNGDIKKKIKNQDKLMSERVIELVIYRSIQAVMNAFEKGFSESNVSKKAIEEHKREMNHLYNFIEETNIRDNESTVSLHKRYIEWTKQYNYHALSLDHFVKKFENAARALGLLVEKQRFSSGGKDRHRLLVHREEE